MTTPTQERDNLGVRGLPRRELGIALNELGIGAQHAKRVFKFLHGSASALEHDLQFGPANYLRLQNALKAPNLQGAIISKCEGGTRKVRLTLGDDLAI